MNNERGKRPIRPFSRAIAREIKAVMKERGITQAAFAEAIDRQQGYISERVSGRYPFTTDELDGLAALLYLTGRQLLAILAERMGPMSAGASNVTPLIPADPEATTIRKAAKRGEEWDPTIHEDI